MAERQTIDQKFSASYNQKGLQPSVGVRDNVRNVKVEEKKLSTQSASTQPRPVINQDTGVRNVKKAANDPVYEQGRNANVVPFPSRRSRTVGRPVPKAQKLKLKRGLSKKGGLKSRLKVTRVNVMLVQTSLFIWLFVQLPLAIISTVAFGMALAIEAVYSLGITNPDDGFFTKGLKGAFRLFTEGINQLSSLISQITEHLFKIDAMSFFDPTTYFFITYTILIALFVIQCLVIYLFYTLSRINSLSGEGEGMKKGAILLAFILYSIPLLNLLPWIILWLGAVWFKPK